VRFWLRITPFVLFSLAAGCRAGGCVANTLGDVVGETGDAFCDRRFVVAQDKKEPSPFCQEIIDTVAQSQFQEDCRDKHKARADDGKCPRARIIGGCKLHKENDDGSEVYDWYYDVTDIEADAARADATTDGGAIFKEPVKDKAAVRTLCEDRSRYEEGAHYEDP
jgi:hypothetical protein